MLEANFFSVFDWAWIGGDAWREPRFLGAFQGWEHLVQPLCSEGMQVSAANVMMDHFQTICQISDPEVRYQDMNRHRLASQYDMCSPTDDSLTSKPPGCQAEWVMPNVGREMMVALRGTKE